MSDQAVQRNSVQILPKEARSLTYREEHELYHSAFSYEAELFSYLALGDEENFMDSRRYNFIIGNTSDDPMRTLKYAAVTFFALAARVCIMYGMPEAEAYQYSDDLILSIDDANTDTDYDVFNVLSRKMVRRMREIRFHSSSHPAVRSAVNYIAENLHTKIKRDDVAFAVGLDPNYLSALFSKEMDISLMEYIQKQKVIEAKALIRYRNMSTADVSYILGFSSESYFCEIFRKIAGITPGEYRKMDFFKSELHF